MSTHAADDADEGRRKSRLSRWIWRSLLIVLATPLLAYAGFAFYITFLMDTIDEKQGESKATGSRPRVGDPGQDSQSSARISKSTGTITGEKQSEVEQRDARFRRDIVGTWEWFDKGRNRFTIKPDGTAVRVYEPEGFKVKAALLFPKRLTIQIRWTVKDGYADFHAISGKPERSFKAAIQWRGERKRRRIVSLSREELVLGNDEKKTTRRCKRVD